MIAADTSTWVAFLEGRGGKDTDWLDRALEDRQLVMVSVVLTELLVSDKPTKIYFDFGVAPDETFEITNISL